MVSSYALHYGSIACIASISAVAVGFGESLASIAALQALARQPGARTEIMRISMLSIALIESAAVFSILMAILIFGWMPETTIPLKQAIAELGIGIAMIGTAGVIGIVAGLPAQSACIAVARQPFMHQKILSLMIILLVLLQTPLISALMVSLFIQFQLPSLANSYDAARLLAAGIAIGFGSIGPCIALAQVAQSALAGVGINRKIFPKMVSFSLITEAIIETPIIFSLIISLMLLFVVPPIQEGDIARVIAHIGATCCIGIGTLGAGFGSGLVAHKAAELITTHSDQYGSIIRTSFFAQGLIETAVLYATLIAFFLLFST